MASTIMFSSVAYFQSAIAVGEYHIWYGVLTMEKLDDPFIHRSLSRPVSADNLFPQFLILSLILSLPGNAGNRFPPLPILPHSI